MSIGPQGRPVAGAAIGLVLYAMLALAPGALAAATPVTVAQTSADLSQHLTNITGVGFGSVRRAASTPVIAVDDRRRFQAVSGFGAAMTDSSAWLIYDELPAAARSQLLQRLFGPNGLHLDFLRVPIGASDYTAGRTPYSYDDLAAGQTDPTLVHFSIAHDEPYILPVLRQALRMNPSMMVLASPWSAPAWMKSNDQLSNVAHAGRLLPADRGVLARYLVRFIEAYARAGVPITAITPQNEPNNPTQYPGMQFSETEEAKFVRLDLAPALRAARLKTQIYAGDNGWSPGSAGYMERLAASRAARDFTGIASHCYYGSPTVLSQLHAIAPRLQQIVSECSPGLAPFGTSELVIAALRNWASAVALWNLALDPSGQPVEPPNAGCPLCTGLVTVDEGSQTVTTTRDFWQLGQASRFIEPGAVRIASNHFVAYGAFAGGQVTTAGLDDVAVLNPDRTIGLLVYNSASEPITFAVRWRGESFTYTLPAGATASFRWRVAAPAGSRRRNS
jgi:glucosylceramidase